MEAPEIASLVIDDRERGLFRVHRSALTSQQIFELERERIFKRCWLYVGHESEIPNPGDFVRRKVGGKPIIFIRGDDGQVRVLFNSCTHRGATICRQDSGNARVFQCFYHAWTFDTKGNLVQVPDEDGYSEGFDRDERALRTPAQYDHYRGLYFLNYDPNAESLIDYLGEDTLDAIDLAIFDPSPDGQVRILPGADLDGMKANWKLLGENSFDAYHGIMHSTFLDYIASYGQGGEVHPESVARDLGCGHATIEFVSPQPKPVAHWHPLFGEEARDELAAIEQEVIERLGPERAERVCHSGRLLVIFPNLVIADGPGVAIRTWWPVAVDSLEQTQWAVALASDTPEQVARRVDMFVTFLGPAGFASPDDFEALEACQEGYETVDELEWSDMSRGMHREKATMFYELQVRTYWRAWLARMQGRKPGRVEVERDPAEAAAAAVSG